MEGQPRLAAMEEAILPLVMETLDGIAASCPKLRRLQEKRIDLARENPTLTTSQKSMPSWRRVLATFQHAVVAISLPTAGNPLFDGGNPGTYLSSKDGAPSIGEKCRMQTHWRLPCSSLPREPCASTG